ncbi:hypothetical protein C8A05DRAFT_36014 [Staphylotrichum tortipilum]|uniref:F-box domain-containing protein n=1 Tax=Staphylotrichum tortipilum TaxID=2831512 RepID=A0AAN6RS10_9PEZI|nr:hypothetical protein C8A05DRAFT_36014 [Staphylotrichum longicolle]
MATRLGLLDLNEDVVRLVLDELSPADLGKVSLVHPSLRDLAQRALFSSIHFWLCDERFHRLFGSPMPNPMDNPGLPIIPSLVAAILRRPDLAACVRELWCGGSCWHSRRDGDDDEEVPKLAAREADLQAAVSFVLRQRGLSYRHACAEGLRRGSPDVYLAVLISQLPRLTHLGLSDFF